MAATGVRGEDLEVEITETLLMESIHEARVVLEQLKDLGVSIAIDDFGTGYCSLGYLKDLPIDVLKVDRSFVQRVETSRDDAEIVAAVIAMAHKLRMKVVAEGIESEAQLEFLRANQCDLGQGYLLGIPVPFARFVQQDAGGSLFWARTGTPVNVGVARGRAGNRRQDVGGTGRGPGGVVFGRGRGPWGRRAGLGADTCPS